MWQLSFSGMGAERPEAKQKRKRRRVGILGIEQESSEDDRDYRPPTSVLRSPSSVPPRQAAADLEADIDLSLAVRWAAGRALGR